MFAFLVMKLSTRHVPTKTARWKIQQVVALKCMNVAPYIGFGQYPTSESSGQVKRFLRCHILLWPCKINKLGSWQTLTPNKWMVPTCVWKNETKGSTYLSQYIFPVPFLYFFPFQLYFFTAIFVRFRNCFDDLTNVSHVTHLKDLYANLKARWSGLQKMLR